MNSSSARDILLAHAIETAAPNEALPDAARCDAITQDVLHALGQPAGKRAAASREQFLAFVQQRAKRIIAASQLPPEIRAVRQHASGIARWVPWAIVLGALLAGFALHRITDPHRVDLLAPSLIGIVLWNLLVYVGMLAAWLHKLLTSRSRKTPEVSLESSHATSSAPAALVDTGGGWRQKLRGRLALPGGGALRKMALTYERNWWRVSRAARRAQWLLWLHLGAAMMAAGALASLWITGLTNEYQVGWESTFLSPETVQRVLNLLFSPLQWLFQTPPWGIEEIRALQGWVSAKSLAPGVRADSVLPTNMGELWVVSYSALLGVLVIAPRLALACWQGARVFWLNRHVHLPLTQPYFQKLQRDFGGLAIHLQVLPYSFDVTPERHAALERFVSREYGAGAHLKIEPTLAYGASVPAVRSSGELNGTAPVLLINLAATPETEIHGELLNAVHERWPADAAVWLWTSDFAERNSGAPRRIEERRALWSEFVGNAGLRVVWVP